MQRRCKLWMSIHCEATHAVCCHANDSSPDSDQDWQQTSHCAHLHAAAQAQDKVQRGLLLDVVIGQCAAVLQLLARKDQALLVGRDALLVLRKGGRGFIRLPYKDSLLA